GVPPVGSPARRSTTLPSARRSRASYPAGAGAPGTGAQCGNGNDDDLDGFTDDGCLLYPLHDHLGSTVGVTDQAGHLVASQEYWPYGAVRSGSLDAQTQTDKQFTGQQVEPGDAGLGL